MKYDRDRNLVRDLLKSADIANTFNGGVSQPFIRFTRETDQYLVYVRVPGVETSSLQVDIINKFLTISYPVKFHYNDETSLDIPHVITTFPISPEVDFKNITAAEENGMLQVIMPFNELAGGYRKSVNIKR